jgi:beta-galactosidase/beta-glucuronidase
MNQFYSRMAAGLLLLTALTTTAQETIDLNSSQQVQWKLTPQDAIGHDSVSIYKEGYDTKQWVPAVVPGCVFTSYVQAGLEKDPNFGDNIYQVDQQKYNRNFWYRTEFTTPALGAGKTCRLHFKGINRKGEVFLNGVRIGMLDGFMERGDFDVTKLLSPSGKNVLAVLVYWPGKPIANHASPTYISSDGWDWMPSVPGLLQGIVSGVSLSVTGGVVIADPWVRTGLPSKTNAVLSLNLGLNNLSAKEETGEVSAVIQPGNIVLTQPVHLRAGEHTELQLNADKFSQLKIQHPLLWWPNGYGDPNLYTCTIKYTIGGQVSDSTRLQFGIRQYSYDTAGGVLHLSINGEKVFVRGGNWGMSEYLLRCRGSEYDLKVKLHRDMNLNMIRNWIGSVTDEELYDACDKYGIMIWDDFWLNSHPNLPDDVYAFNKNAVEKIKRLRNHPSIAVWCGDNEGYPLPPLNGWLREDVKTFDGGDRWYQPNSHSDALTGSGPWTNFHPNWYFTKYPGGFGGNAGWGFRTEIGTAVFTTYESFKKFIPDSAAWPRSAMWDKHFFGKSAANAGPDNYDAAVKSYGAPTGIEDYCRKAQLVNIETNKALYEGWQHHMWNDASGVMTWMSQSAYPSFVWQTYDYYYDLTGAYWGVKKACEPVHIQWSYADNSVKVVNTTLENRTGLKAEAVIYDLNGRVQTRYGKTATINAAPDNTASCFDLTFSTENRAYKKTAVASSGAVEAPDVAAITDGNSGSRWSSNYSDNEWVYVDLGDEQTVKTVTLNWEAAYASAYKIQVSTNAQRWTDVYSTSEGKGGVEQVSLTPVKARYVKMQGIKRATSFGYSLYDLEVYSNNQPALTDVQFIKLLLTDAQGKLISDNFYWRSNKLADYTALGKLPKAKLKYESKLVNKDGKAVIEVLVSNPTAPVAFAIRVQAIRTSDGERLLPAIMNDNYFTLFKGEHKKIEIEFDAALLQGGGYKLIVEPYNR